MSELLISFPFAELVRIHGNDPPELVDEGEVQLLSIPRPEGQPRASAAAQEQPLAMIEMVVGGTRWEILPTSRALKVGEFTFVFSLDEGDPETSLTLTLLATASLEDVGIFEVILENVALVRESEVLMADPEAQEGEAALAQQAYSTALARGIQQATTGLASGLVVSAAYASKTLGRVADFARPEAPTQTPLILSDSTKRRFKRTETIAGWASSAAGTAVGALGWIGSKAADGVLWATGFDEPPAPGQDKKASAVREASHATLAGFGEVWEGMEDAGRTVLLSARDSTASVVHERYGPDAAEASISGMNAAGHGFETVSCVRRLGPRTLAKAAAKSSAKSALNKSRASQLTVTDGGCLERGRKSISEAALSHQTLAQASAREAQLRPGTISAPMA